MNLDVYFEIYVLPLLIFLYTPRGYTINLVIPLYLVTPCQGGSMVKLQ